MGLDTVELIMAVEEEFDIAIPDSRAIYFTTPNLLAEGVAEFRAAKGLPVIQSEIDERIRLIVIDFFGVPEDNYTPDGKFVEHFGLD